MTTWIFRTIASILVLLNAGCVLDRAIAQAPDRVITAFARRIGKILGRLRSYRNSIEFPWKNFGNYATVPEFPFSKPCLLTWANVSFGLLNISSANERTGETHAPSSNTIFDAHRYWGHGLPPVARWAGAYSVLIRFARSTASGRPPKYFP